VTSRTSALGGDVVVAGAGLIGLAIAFELAQRGATVRVYDRAEPGRAASWAAAGMLAPFTEIAGDAELQGLCAASLAEYPAFVERVKSVSGVDPELRLDGIVHAAFDDASVDALTRRCQEFGARDVGCEMLDRRQLLAAEPWLGAAARGGLLVRGEGHVDNRRLGRALLAACGGLGVSIAQVRALRVNCDARRVLGVSTEGGFASAFAVVNACGAWAASLDGLAPEERPPVRPVKGQMLSLETPIGFVRHATWVPGAYVVPRGDGRVLVGATVEDVGFDARVTAEGMERLLHAALLAAPSLGAFTIGETWAGLRPATPDGRPFLGATRLAGLFLAAGHYRNGILLAPATARFVADAVESGATADFGPFSLARLETEGAGATRRTHE
jgi:glycine oxidase